MKPKIKMFYYSSNETVRKENSWGMKSMIKSRPTYLL